MKTTTRGLIIAATLALTGTVHAETELALKPDETVPGCDYPVPPTPSRDKVSTDERPRIDLVFALDTTGSMSGLIEGAKQKIWSIANKLISGKPTPRIRIGLVAFRDVGDAYVTQRNDLSEDIDQVYSQLKTFQVDGGGDTPEHVVQALDDAVNRMSWEKDGKTLKVVFVVGDAPPHFDHPGQPDHKKLLGEARQKGIRINAVRCGGDPTTEQTFSEIARLGGGDFLSIAQDGGMVAVSTPHDAELAKLNSELAATSLDYGDAKMKDSARRKRDAAMSLAAPAAAERASWAAAADEGVAYGEGDLLNQLESGKKLEAIEEEAMPDALRGLSLEKKKEAVEAVKQKRAEIEGRIREESARRDAWIESNQAAGPADSFDKSVKDVLSRQAAEVQVTFD